LGAAAGSSAGAAGAEAAAGVAAFSPSGFSPEAATITPTTAQTARDRTISSLAFTGFSQKHRPHGADAPGRRFFHDTPDGKPAGATRRIL